MATYLYKYSLFQSRTQNIIISMCLFWSLLKGGREGDPDTPINSVLFNKIGLRLSVTGN